MAVEQFPIPNDPAMPRPDFEPLAVVGMDCCLPGASDLQEFEELLFAARSGVSELPSERFDRELYFDSRRGQAGKSYTTLGGTVPTRPVDLQLIGLTADEASLIDPVHLRFCEVAVRAWKSVGLRANEDAWRRTGVFVGHSGATQNGGGLNLATQIDEGLDFLNDLPDFARMPVATRKRVLARVAQRIRESRPRRTPGRIPNYQGYTAAALPAQVLGFEGPRIVCDAACASSLFAMQQAIAAIRLGRIEAAIVGGATTNGVDNLILFSQSQACSDSGSCPFDNAANGLISSEGYAAVVVVPQAIAQRLQLPILGLITGLGIASDGRGKSLWAPRAEGQRLAIRRAYPADDPLAIDYLEAHATSTQLGDATELNAVESLLSDATGRTRTSPLLIGSLKSNLGHTLETAGVAGLVKILLAMRRGVIPASLNYQSPSQSFDWSAHQVKVVDRAQPWKPQRGNRRSAVSAFGIGGLNAHLFVQQASGSKLSTPLPSRESGTGSKEPIAIVGRGTILPGAHHVQGFRQLLESGESVIGSPPEDRWRPGQGVEPGADLKSFTTPTCQGGFIRDYVFDSQSYRIPPKQVAQANPLQWMLLDSVTQAITEMDQGQWNFDRQKAGVVIGTIFSGDFGSQLQLGLRLPEIVRELEVELKQLGYSPEQIKKLAQDYRQQILKARPALLDETGSFTASTLASRIAKTFDLMGGACAIDVDDASGLAALGLAVDQLRAGTWEVAICGAAERAMDLSKFEQLDLSGKLVRSGRIDDIPSNCEQILPGEGAVVLMLERLSVAQAAGHSIYGIIEEVDIAMDNRGHENRHLPVVERDRELARQIGYLTGAQSLVQLLKKTIQWETSKSAPGTEVASSQIASRTEDGVRYDLSCRPVETVPVSVPSVSVPSVSFFSAKAKPVTTHGPAASYPTADDRLSDHSLNRMSVLNTGHKILSKDPQAMTPTGQTARSMQHEVSCRLVRLQTANETELLAAIDSALTQPQAAFEQQTTSFNGQHPSRLIVLASSAQELSERLGSLRRNWDRGRRNGVFETERAIVWHAQPQPRRVAWTFPGQGSQHSEVPSILDESTASMELLALVDSELQKMGLEALSPQLQSSSSAAMTDIWWNQLWVLGMSLALTAELKSLGMRPDLVAGHSFGEYSALVACGSLSLPQALRMVKSRADAVSMTVREPGQLISVRGTPNVVETAIRNAGLSATITHHNAPQQTVIATCCDDVEAVRKSLTAANLASVIVPVPVAYHTDRLTAAENLLRNTFSHERFLPPTCGFLSTTTAKYVAEPEELRGTLVSHLTNPVLYVPSVERLIADGFQLFVEVGPNQILSRLNTEIAGDRALCLSLDVPGRSHKERLLLLQGAMEITEPLGAGVASNRVAEGAASAFARKNGDFPESTSPRMRTAQPTAAPTSSTPAAVEHDVEIVDFRRTRKKDAAPKTPVEETNGHSRSTRHDALVEQSPSATNGFSHSTSVEAEQPVASANGPSLEEVQNFLLTVVVDLTGYSPDVIDFDADLEADLGVDSIKKAQVIGELAECFEMSVAPTGMKMSDLTTLGDIAVLGVQYGTSRNEPAGVTAEVSTPQHAPVEVAEAALETSSSSIDYSEDGGPIDVASIERFLIDLVVDQTGYSPEVVDLDADMEGDLGIDSIKQAQLLGEVQQQFDLQTVATEGTSLTSFPTLRSILNFLAENLPGNGAAAFRVSVPETSDAVDENPNPREPSKKNSTAFSERPTDTLSASSRSASSERVIVGEPVIGIEPNDQTASETTLMFRVDEDAPPEESWARGWQRGQQHRLAIQAALRLLVDRGQHATAPVEVTETAQQELAGLAAGAGVSLPAVLHAHSVFSDVTVERETSRAPRHVAVESRRSAPKSVASPEEKDGPALKSDQSMRFVMRMARAPQREGMSKIPRFSGPALVVGRNAISAAIASRFEQEGRECHIVSGVESLEELDAQLKQLWSSELTPHLFITTSHDAEAMQVVDARFWQFRRFDAVEVPYRVCQLWMQRMIDENRMDGGSVVAVTNLGGDFGFSGQSTLSPEGGLGGLIKAMLIEAWMRGYRATPMKVIDLAPETTPTQAVDGIWRELAIPSYDMEVALQGDERFAIQPVFKPLAEVPQRSTQRLNGHTRVKSGGVWVVTGGARGITSMVVRELAKRHNLKLHLVGTAPVPQVSEELRTSAAKDRLRVRRAVMADAARRNENGMAAWRNVEKALEIDATLRLCRDEGVTASYHSCDVSDLEQLEETLSRIRVADGPIVGVIHGAGIGQDARFDRKRADKVDQCLRAKIDGCINLMDATQKDPLDSFVAFGSISGRFGANGHTDYSFANDSLAKLMGRYRRERPEVASVTFHWHAWGDIGMATKPETKLALEMINLEFMPAKEGLAHFLDELELGGDEPEVLITDRAYYRKFFPIDRNVLSPESETAPPCFPLLDPEGDLPHPHAGPFAIELNPERERFLNQHLVQGKPTLPFVVALEMMAEAARTVTGESTLVEARNVEAVQAIKWSTSAPLTIHVKTEAAENGTRCELIADVRRRDGRIVAKDRTYFKATMTTGDAPYSTKAHRPEMSQLDWTPIEYLEPDAPIYHGPDLQCLQSIALDGDQAFGLISASSSVQLGGGHRPTFGWSVHCAAMDACLYASALFAGKKFARPSLPVRFERIRFGRLPDPGEPCLVAVQLLKERPEGLDLAFQLIGLNGDLLLDVDGYQVGWLL